MKILLKHFFDASHQLPDTEHLVTKACARLHGHTYAVKVEIEGEANKAGMIVDFGAIKNVINKLDHQHINDIFKATNLPIEATAENIAKFISLEIRKDLNLWADVYICEGYKGEDRASWVYFSPKKR
jgi:6-pyruvoyltetrahydropterin/6-carboxytetrahydropterin synthase